MIPLGMAFESQHELELDLYRTVLEKALLGAARVELHTGRMLWVNFAFASILGYEPSELIGKTIFDLTHPEDQPSAQSHVSKLLSGGLRTSSVERRYRRKAGDYIWVNITVTVMHDIQGAPSHLIGIIQDINDRKVQELALRDSEARLRLVMEMGRFGVWEMNPITDEVVWSKVFKELCGVPEDFRPSKDSFQELVHAADRELVSQGARDLKVGRSDFPPFRIVRPDGATRWLQNVGQVARVRDEKNGMLMGVLVDVTHVIEVDELMEAQKAKMVAASKMSALGEMAGGLAHEINNPIAIIHGNAMLLAQIASRGEATPEETRRAAEIIAQTAERISKITRSLRAFARDGEQDPYELASLKGVIDETMEFCRERFSSHGIELRTNEIDPGLRIECRAVQISQVLLNLLNNAHDAVEKGSEKWISVTAADIGESVELKVMDSGPGIPPDMRDRVFQPFFTTKELGKGTGLGLSVATGIVESHSGSLGVSASSEHTCFVVTLPKAQR